MRLRDSLGALGDRRFAWYFSARTISTAGSSMAPVALTFAILELTGSAGALAQVLAARTAAMVVFLLVGGVVSDRMSRTTVMQVSHALTFLTQGLAAALFVTGRAELGAIIAIEAVNGAVSAFTMPAMMGIVPLVVDRSRLQQANALLSFSRSGLAIIGPSIAGVLVVTVGAGWALAADSFAYVLAILCLLGVRLPGRVHDVSVPRPSMIADLREGWGEFTSRTWLWLIVVVFGVINAIQAGALSVLGPLIATRVPALGVNGWALALSAEAAGTVVMTLFMLRLSFRFPLRAGMIGIAAIAVPIGLLGVAPTTLPLVVAMVVAGAGTEVFGVGWSTALHEHIPEEVLSRVSSYDMLGSIVAIPVGTLAFGALAALVDVRTLLVVSAVTYAAIALGTTLSRSVRTLERSVRQPVG
ncbi:MFS transporter [Lapillicoccus sp.]|uniref:MFS transporter n=1 Tax=Lapillicoccus sp. TaxID=1909287 RepID=UPI0025E9F1B7|nr:MFS transporter [Lapillicoccus sp.]